MKSVTKGQMPADEGRVLFHQELEDLPLGLRWHDWTGRVEAALFASAIPVGRED